MSCATYGQNGYGMFLNVSEMAAFCRAYAKANQMNVDDDDFSEVICELDSSDLTDEGCYDGNERTISHLDGKPHEEDGNEFCEGLFLYADRQGNIFAKPDCSYRNIHEMADEFRKKFEAYLPENFDFEAHMAHYAGAVTC